MSAYRWIVYLHQPFGYFIEPERVENLADAVALWRRFKNDVGDPVEHSGEGCSAFLYPYDSQSWQDAMEFADTGNPFDYPSKVIERGPRGGARLTNA